MNFQFDSTLAQPALTRPIFAVEACEADRELFLDTLKEAGIAHPGRFFSNSNEMIESLIAVMQGATPPLVCFLDVKMPGMGGLDVLRWIRLQGGLADVSVVLLAESEDAGSLAEALHHGAQCYTRKFPSAAQLREIVAEAEKFSAVVSGSSAFHLPCNLMVGAQAAPA